MTNNTNGSATNTRQSNKIRKFLADFSSDERTSDNLRPEITDLVRLLDTYGIDRFPIMVGCRGCNLLVTGRAATEQAVQLADLYCQVLNQY